MTSSRSTPRCRFLVALCLAAGWAAGAAAQEPPAAPAPSADANPFGRKYPPRIYGTVRLEGPPPSIDGRLDDEAWKQGEWAGDYTQQIPTEGAKPSRETELKILKLEKHEFLTLGPTEETHERGWRLPPQGKILKSEVNNYIEADKEIVNLSLKIGIQHEKIDLLESIIKSLTARGFNIKAAIEWERFKVGI